MIQDEAFGQQLLDKIEEEKLAPRSRWRFLLQDYVVWSAGAIALLLGAGAVSVIIYLAENNDWAMYREIDSSAMEFILLTLPYFWLVSLGVFMAVVYFNLKHTKHGYKYSFWLVVTVPVATSIGLGFIFSLIGIGGEIDDVLGRRAPLYSQIINPHVDYWTDPANGRLAGIVIVELNNGRFGLIDKERREWQVLAEETKLLPMAVISVGEPLRMLGEQLGEHDFRAAQILPMRQGRGYMGRFLPASLSERALQLPPPPSGCRADRTKDMIFLFEQFPALKQDLIDDINSRREEMKETILANPQMLMDLRQFGVPVATWQ